VKDVFLGVTQRRIAIMQLMSGIAPPSLPQLSPISGLSSDVHSIMKRMAVGHGNHIMA